MLAEHVLGLIRRCLRGHAHDKLDFKHVLAQPARTLFCTPAAAGTYAAANVTKGTAQKFIFVEGHARSSFWDALSGRERHEPRQFAHPVIPVQYRLWLRTHQAATGQKNWAGMEFPASGKAEGSGLYEHAHLTL